MTEEEIVKALECCKKDDCDNCPNTFGNCYANLAGYALDLIHRLQADNIQLKWNYVDLKERYIKVLDLNEKVIAEQKAEIERLKEENEYLDGCAKQFLADYQKCEIERNELQEQVDELTAKNTELKGDYVKGYEAGVYEGWDNAVKETAEKFAERVKMAFYYEFDELIPSIMADKIDEICKDISEGKV